MSSTSTSASRRRHPAAVGVLGRQQAGAPTRGGYTCSLACNLLIVRALKLQHPPSDCREALQEPPTETHAVTVHSAIFGRAIPPSRPQP
jgi:hypothetical protein